METKKNFEVVTEEKMKISNSFHGWKAETLTSVNGQTFQISTSKNSKGCLNSYAIPVLVKKTDGFRTVQFDFDGVFNKNVDLVSEKLSRVTENAVKQQHFKALTIFENMVNNGEIQPVAKKEPKIGTILFLDGYDKTKGSPKNKHVIYNIEHTKYGVKYYTVELDTLLLSVKDYVKNYDDKFGIGIYFDPDYVFDGSQDDLNNLVIDAKLLEEEEKKKEEASKLMREQIRNAKIEEGKKLVNIPEWAKTVIVAEYYNNDSDSMTDYFSTSISKTVYLAFSKSSRNNMNELKTASLRFDETSNFLELFKNPIDGEDTIVESTRDHSYLPNYFFGTSRWFGWKINKQKYFDLSNENNLESLYIAAAEGRYFCHSSDANNTEIKESKGVQIVDYSDKSFAVIGDTKPLKDGLKKLGGRFKFRLKCGAGWIFPKTKQSALQKFLNELA